MLSCVERDRATIKAPWKPVLYKLALHRGKPVHYKLALHRGMPVHTVTFSRIRVHRCRTPCKFVVGRGPLSESTVRVKKSSSLIVLGGGAMLKHDALYLRSFILNNRCVRMLSTSLTWYLGVSCVFHNLPAVRHSVSRKRRD